MCRVLGLCTEAVCSLSSRASRRQAECGMDVTVVLLTAAQRPWFTTRLADEVLYKVLHTPYGYVITHLPGREAEGRAVAPAASGLRVQVGETGESGDAGIQARGEPSSVRPRARVSVWVGGSPRRVVPRIKDQVTPTLPRYPPVPVLPCSETRTELAPSRAQRDSLLRSVPDLQYVLRTSVCISVGPFAIATDNWPNSPAKRRRRCPPCRRGMALQVCAQKRPLS